jgi:16S rRNA (cytidine1402-2'-O)-methyltransferase
VTERARAVLAGADLVAAEDTRVARKLLRHLGLAPTLTSYHEHNAAQARPVLMKALEDGGVVAVISDAGTPLISDPGYRLVRAAQDAGIAVVPIPGPSAVTAALAAAGLPTDRFLFLGFLPAKQGERARLYDEVGEVAATLVCFEAARRLPERLAELAARFPGREAAVARELTKLHEEILRAPLEELAELYAGAAPKGEAVLLLGPPAVRPAGTQDLDAALRTALAEMSLRDAAAHVAEALSLPRKRVYARALELAQDR